MSDIDFDELDKAVASVLNAGGSPAPAGTAPAAEPAPASQSAPAPSETDTATTPAEPAPDDVKTPAVSAQDLHAQPVKPVQRGRFLDMVHPSGDMARPALSPQAAQRPTPATSNGAFVSDVIAPRPATALASVAATSPITAAPAATAQPAINTPAPTEETPDFFAASPVGEAQRDAVDAGPHKPPVTEDSKPTEIPVSPFIPDAKVEKRPLGAFSAPDAAAPSSLPSGDDLDRRLAEIEGEDNVTAVVSAAETPNSAASAPVNPNPAATEKPTKISVTPVSTDIAPATIATPQPAAVTEAEPATGFSLFPHHEHAAKTPKLRGKKPPKYGRGTFIWLTVAVAVMLIGFGVGASLYILLVK